jgi:hypothetical protein
MNKSVALSYLITLALGAPPFGAVAQTAQPALPGSVTKQPAKPIARTAKASPNDELIKLKMADMSEDILLATVAKTGPEKYDFSRRARESESRRHQPACDRRNPRGQCAIASVSDRGCGPGTAANRGSDGITAHRCIVRSAIDPVVGRQRPASTSLSGIGWSNSNRLTIPVKRAAGSTA